MDLFPTDLKLQSPHEDIHHHHHHLFTNSNQILISLMPHDHHHGHGQALPGRRSPSTSSPGFGAGEQLESPNGMEHEDMSEDDGPPQNLGERKKIRLNMEQVKALEKSFESGNKLDPERKLQLAKALRLQPRQVAIWFQNRRAWCKNKQLEKDYDLLKRQFDSVKAVNDALQAQNQKLHEEILALRGVSGSSTTRIHYESINLNKETEGCGSTSSSRENSSYILRLNVSFSTGPSAIEQEHEHIQHHDHKQHRTQISRQLLPSTGFRNIVGGISNDHPSGLWPWFEQPQQHLS